MTDPLVPAEVDLRDFPYMPVQVDRLRRSKEWLLAKKDPAIGFYSFNLWTASWHERPPGSLEDDDDVLADRAMCALARWKKVRDKVLRKWVKCSDGRLYHPIVAEVVLESWAAKCAQRHKTAAATAARVASSRQRHDNGTLPTVDNDTTTLRPRGDNVTLPSRSPSEVKGSEVEVKRSGSEGILNRDVGVTPTITREAHADATGNGAVENITKSKAKPPHTASNSGQHWDDKAWVVATAATVERRQRPGESYEDWRDAVFMLVDGLRKGAHP